MKTALVTGAAGFVGRHMARALEDQGYSVLAIDLIDPAEFAWRGQCDVRDYFRKADARFDLVVHCAAVVGGRTMIDGAPLQLAVEDLSIDAALFSWAMRTRPGRIVYYSSSAAYPVTMQDGTVERRLAEDFQPMGDWYGLPDQTYGWVKLTGERLAAEANAAGIRTHVFRPFSGYGGDQALDYPFPAIIRRAIEQVSGPHAEFKIWGHTGSARDWVHIDDVVGCTLAAIEADDIGPMNICTGEATTFAALAGIVLDELGKNAVARGDSTKPMGVFWRVGDPARMERVYTPTISIVEGVRRAIKEYPL